MLTASYPPFIERIVVDHFEKRSVTDPVRRSYETARELHKTQRRGQKEYQYIAHPLLVYNLVYLCLQDATISKEKKNVMYCAALLHDCIENYGVVGTEKRKKGTEETRALARQIIQDTFDDPHFAKQVMTMVEELTNPLEYKDDKGREISKAQWQENQIKKISPEARLIKICDQTANHMTTVTGPSSWPEQKISEYVQKARAIIRACKKHTGERNPLHNAITVAASMFEIVETQVGEETRKSHENGSHPPEITTGDHYCFDLPQLYKLGKLSLPMGNGKIV